MRPCSPGALIGQPNGANRVGEPSLMATELQSIVLNTELAWSSPECWLDLQQAVRQRGQQRVINGVV